MRMEEWIFLSFIISFLVRTVSTYTVRGTPARRLLGSNQTQPRGRLGVSSSRASNHELNTWSIRCLFDCCPTHNRSPSCYGRRAQHWSQSNFNSIGLISKCIFLVSLYFCEKFRDEGTVQRAQFDGTPVYPMAFISKITLTRVNINKQTCFIQPKRQYHLIYYKQSI